ncbi:Glutathione S-transferase [Mycena venus]|uniref:glutathione transferase n=1 Tax=Mycena venus TaxID=2733690 RepID=A0A8H6Y9P5_9AGAR|nr:Glutathione S-transferase [Mycena venus]
MVLKLYAAPIARGSSGVVAFVLAEKQIPFELIVVDMSANDHKTAEFLAMHPFGQVPVINDDGFILYEGRAICRYPAEKYADQGTPLLPPTLEGRALVEQAASIEYANFYPAIAKLGMELVANPRRGLPVNQVVVTQALAELSTTLDVYDTILGKQKFLAGDQFTLADVFHLIAAPRLASEGVDILTTKGPNLARWWNEVISRLAWVRLQAEGIKSTPSW